MPEVGAILVPAPSCGPCFHRPLSHNVLTHFVAIIGYVPVVFVMECQIPYDTLHEFAWSCPVPSSDVAYAPGRTLLKNVKRVDDVAEVFAQTELESAVRRYLSARRSARHVGSSISGWWLQAAAFTAAGRGSDNPGLLNQSSFSGLNSMFFSPARFFSQYFFTHASQLFPAAGSRPVNARPAISE